METTLSHIYSLGYWRELLTSQGFEKPYYCRYHISGGYFAYKKDKIVFCIENTNTHGYFNHLKIFHNDLPIPVCEVPLPLGYQDNKISDYVITHTPHYAELQQLLEAIKNPDLLPLCLNISWASRLLEFLIKDWTKES
jgi:hypothetical protein